jgi:glutamine amidotransferase
MKRAGKGIAVIDYGAGNITSVLNALTLLGAEHFVASDPEELSGAPSMIFPGDGEAVAAMTELRRAGLDEGIREFFRSGRKILGICIGCQIVLQRSEERDAECLGLLEGTVKRFSGGSGLKVPHMGWNTVRFDASHPVLARFTGESAFYFVHSYYPAPASACDVCGWTEYGISFPSAIARDNLIAFQFHPEKSGEVGLRLLGEFLSWKG